MDDQCLAFAVMGGLMLFLAYRPVWQERLAFFAWAGRMALTNYILHAAVIEYASSPHGLGLKLRPYLGVLAIVLLFGGQVLFSRFWLARYRFGPFEWVWRSLTYWRLQPWRVASR